MELGTLILRNQRLLISFTIFNCTIFGKNLIYRVRKYFRFVNLFDFSPSSTFLAWLLGYIFFLSLFFCCFMYKKLNHSDIYFELTSNWLILIPETKVLQSFLLKENNVFTFVFVNCLFSLLLICAINYKLLSLFITKWSSK